MDIDLFFASAMFFLEPLLLPKNCTRLARLHACMYRVVLVLSGTDVSDE